MSHKGLIVALVLILALVLLWFLSSGFQEAVSPVTNTITRVLIGTQNFFIPDDEQGVGLTKSAAQLIPVATFKALTWDTEDYDTGALFSSLADPENVTIVTEGNYQISASAFFASANPGYRGIGIYINGIQSTVAYCTLTTGVETVCPITRTVHLSAGTDVAIWVFQNTIAPLNVNGGAAKTNFQVNQE